MSRLVHLFIACVAVAMPATLQAQDKPVASVPASASTGPSIGLRVQVVLSRYQGEKRISAMPYTLQLTANERQATNLRMGTDVPVTNNVNPPGFNYRPIGTNIDCRAETAGDGRYRIYVTVHDSSVHFTDRQKSETGTASSTTMPPAFRTFTANFVILLSDGQTTQYTTATDPASGEVLKVDATLNVLK